MSLSKKIISFFVVFSMTISFLTISSYAEYAGGGGRSGDFWSATYEAYNSGNTVYNPGGIYGGGAGRSDLAEVYDQYVDGLPANGIASSGDMLIYPNNWQLVQYDTYLDPSHFGPSISVGACVYNDLAYKYIGAKTEIGYVYNPLYLYDGVYEVVPDYCSGVFIGAKCFYIQGSVDGVDWKNVTSSITLSSRDVFFSTYDYPSYIYWRVYAPLKTSTTSYSAGKTITFKRGAHLVYNAITPSSGYESSSRPACLTFNLGLDVDGSLTAIGYQSIVNETNNVYYNPVTNTTYDMTGWTFDYSTRTYNVDLSNDTTVSVEYADQSINITEGDTIYNIYYMVDPDTIEGDCQHVYTRVTTSVPTCAAPGIDTYTCNLCGRVYTQSTAATGHTWVVNQIVQTQYDEAGELLTEGYTLYECSICGEQYKSTDGTLPPSGNDDSSGSSDDTSGWFDKIYQKLCDILIAIGAIEAPEINVEVEVIEGEVQETQESWFTKFISKFSFLSSIGNIYKQLVADVTSDAATAAAVADGAVLLTDVTGDHANTEIATVSYTAPELAISFGASDKYGVDWVNIKPLNLSWYAPYKETVDGILSGILWLSYLFLLIKRAPGIIQGSEMVTEDRIKIDAWRSRH